MSTTSGPIVPGWTGRSQLLLPTVSVLVLFLALVLASMVEPSSWPRAVRVETFWPGRRDAGSGVGKFRPLFVRIPSKCALQDSAAGPREVHIGAGLLFCPVN